MTKQQDELALHFAHSKLRDGPGSCLLCASDSCGACVPLWRLRAFRVQEPICRADVEIKHVSSGKMIFGTLCIPVPFCFFSTTTTPDPSVVIYSQSPFAPFRRESHPLVLSYLQQIESQASPTPCKLNSLFQLSRISSLSLAQQLLRSNCYHEASSYSARCPLRCG